MVTRVTIGIVIGASSAADHDRSAVTVMAVRRDSSRLSRATLAEPHQSSCSSAIASRAFYPPLCACLAKWLSSFDLVPLHYSGQQWTELPEMNRGRTVGFGWKPSWGFFFICLKD